jgi:predicted hydrocarbon binding protein
MSKHPWHQRLFWKVIPGRFFSIARFLKETRETYKDGRVGITEYLTEQSNPDEHYLRIHEADTTWGLNDIGTRLCFNQPPILAGLAEFVDKNKGSGRDWNAVETKCVGEGAPYCEFKIVPRPLDEVKEYLTAIDSSIVENISNRLMGHVKQFVNDQIPLGERVILGNGIHLQHLVLYVTLPAVISDRYRMAVRFGGAMAGKRLSEYLMEDLGLNEEETITQIINLLEYCKVGKVSVGETIRIKENSECYGIESTRPIHYFTSSFLNGVFVTVKNQHIKEMRCISIGDPYCEWEFR